MDGRSDFTPGIVYDDLSAWLALARNAREKFGWLLDGGEES